MEKNIVVYCSSRADLPTEVEYGAGVIARTIAECDARLIYGGVNAGMMHMVARTARDHGAEVVGVIPEIFAHRADEACCETVLTKDLNTRKSEMINLGDIFIVLPGGIGTIDEWISTLSHFMVLEKGGTSCSKPILVWNHEGMYDSLIKQLKESDASVYGAGRNASRSECFATAEGLAARLKELCSQPL